MTTKNSPSTMQPIPRVDETPGFPLALRAVVALLSLIVGGSAIAGIVVASRQGPPILVGFEAVILLASAFSFLIGLGYFRQAPAMGVFITGGAVLVGACLGEPRLVLRFMGNPGTGVPPGGVDLLPYAYARLAVALAFFALGAFIVLIQRPMKSFRRLAVGLTLALPLALMALAFTNASIRSTILSLNGIALAGVIVVLMIVVLGLVAASGHAIIRAFEAGLPEHADDQTTG